MLASKRPHAHYMLKEIHEQPDRVEEVLGRTLKRKSGEVVFEDSALSPRELGKIRRLLLVACGTSWHAALAGEYLIESLAGVPVEVECASELH